MRAHSSLRLGSLRRTTPELLVSPWYCAWGFCVVWEAGLPHKTSSPPTQRRNGRAFSSLTARGGGLPVGVRGLGHGRGYPFPHQHRRTAGQSGDSPELAQGLPYKGKSMRNRGFSSPMPFLLIPRSLLRGGFIFCFYAVA